MSAKNYLRILQLGATISLFFVLFVFPSLLFPYISSKQLAFNILMEVMLAIWLVFIWRYPAYRPKLNLVIYSLLAYFAAILFSSIFGVDFNLSFWGDVERMLGFFHLFHFLIFFFIIITVFRTWREWRTLLLSSLVAATIVSLVGLFGKNSYSTIGNTAYVSGYLIFNFFFAAILFFRSRNKWRYAYLIPTLIMFLQFKNMRTSGAIIGLGIGIFLAIVLVGILHEKRKIKMGLLSFAAILVIVVAFIFSQQQAAWFQNSFLRNLTSQKSTFQTRLISWQGAWRDFGEHPILGTGFGNYAIIFDRQFDPKFFNYDRVETYFDRAHNNLIDIASTTGILGLLTYLSIFVFALLVLFRQLKSGGYRINDEPQGRRNLELVLLFSLMAAYFIQNLAVFDSFVTYIALMIMLGLIIWLPQESNFSQEQEERVPGQTYLAGGRDIWLLVFMLILAFIAISSFNLKPWRMLSGAIEGYTQIVTGRPEKGLGIYQEALTDTPLDRDARTTLINLAAANPVLFTSLPADQIQPTFDYVISLAEKNLAYNEQDNVFLLQLAQLYDVGARIFYEDEEKASNYTNLALEFSDRAIAASPGRIPVYFSKAQSLLVADRVDEAIEVMEYAASLNPDYPNSYCRLGQIYAIKEQDDKALEALHKCLDGGAVNQLGTSNSLLATASFLLEKEDYAYAIIIVEKLAQDGEGGAELWLNLAQLYLIVGDSEKAEAAAGQAVLLDPSLQTDAQNLFKEE